MKKTLLLIAMVITSYNVFAFTTMGVWRWRNDDGSETSATWKADQNMPVLITSDEAIRLRIELYNNGDGGLKDAVIEDSIDGVAGWQTITTTPGTNAFVLAGTSAFVSDHEPTTKQLSGQGSPWVFTPGYIFVSTDKYPNITLGTNQATESEYVLKPSANIQPGKTYFFRINAAEYTDGYIFPSLTTSEVLPVHMASFKVEADKNRALITWTTATEENNSRFDVERSNDSKNYSVIATVKGNGTTSLAHNYKVTDSKPLNGDNYYRIKQYDADGKYQVSDIRALKFVLQQALINVFPNPSRGDINFAVQNYNGSSLKAMLYNVSGKMVHQESINTNTTGSYKLNLASKLSAGVYILKLEGSDLSEKLKVVVQ